MSTATVTGTVPDGVPPTVEPPPIAVFLPLLRLASAGSSLLFRLAGRFLLTTVYPLRVIWSIIHALLSPVFITFKIAFAITLSTPLSIIHMIAVGLYPVYVFCTVACIIGAAVGILGHHISTVILNHLARSGYFTRPPSPPPAVRPSSPQATLRKRKRKSVRLQ